MSRLLAAALVAAAAGGAVAAPSGSPTFVLSSSAALGGAAGADGAPGGVSYESLSQADLAAGLLRASGAAPAQKAGWEATHWPAGEAAPQLLAVLVGSVDAARQELRDALASSSASLALPNAAAAQPRGLAADLAAALAAARAAGGKVGDFLLSDSCTEAVAAEGSVSVPGEAGALGAAVGSAVASAPEGSTSVLLACHDAAPGALQQLRDALAAAAPRHLVVLAAAEAAPAPSVPAKRRALLAAPASCDDTCQAQASLLMFAAVMMLILIMALSGVCCLHALEGPSRFEISKEQHSGKGE